MRTSTSEFPVGPDETPKALIYLIATIAAVSILATLFNGLFAYFFQSTGPEEWLSLSLRGFQNFYLWQPISYPFIHYSYSAGISLSYLISLFFNLYILWFLGSSIIDRIGLKSFFKLSTISSVVSGAVALLIMEMTTSYIILSGTGPALLALLSFFTLLYSDADIRLFFIFPIKIKWLAAGIFAGILLESLSHLDFVTLGFYLTGMVFGYLYGVIAYELKGPFKFLTPFEEWVTHLFNKSAFDSGAKIIDIKTGKSLDDEIFVDQMLAKISKSGEESLSSYERTRLMEISKRKK